MKKKLEFHIKKKKVKKRYICPFCEKKRELCNKTIINYRGNWINGCQNCFIESIEHPDKFNDRDYKLLD